jgi:hypothetical protein
MASGEIPGPLSRTAIRMRSPSAGPHSSSTRPPWRLYLTALDRFTANNEFEGPGGANGVYFDEGAQRS